MSEKPLLGWLERRKESSIVLKTKHHASKVLDTAVNVDKALGLLLANKRAEVKDALHRAVMDEKAADNIEVMIFEELSRGELESKEREDLMHLVKRIDDSSDWFKVAARNLELILETGEEVPETLWSGFKEMMKNAVDCCRSLIKTLDALGLDEQAVRKAQMNVNLYEHKVDELYFGVKKMMVKEVKDARAIVVLNDLLVGIENATDACKSAADSIYLIVIARHLE